MKKRYYILLLLILFFFTFSPPAEAYEVATHAYLTDEAIDFFIKYFPSQKVPDELRDFLIDGSRREDDVPRWMNHFYDPVNERGLSYDSAIDPGINFGTWEKAKDWAEDEENQNKAKYKVPATIASILTALQRFKISDISSQTNFAWQNAIRLYLQGEKEDAMFTLGHVLHLIQDMSVPDHTRNDIHPDGSPYESYAGKFTLTSSDEDLKERLGNTHSISYGNLENYFNELAKYSNNNFYSEDTIGIQSGYGLPEVNYSESEIKNGLFYLTKSGEKDSNYYLFAKKSLKNLLVNDSSGIIFDDDIVLSSYWSRLSVKAVQYSAGVIDLFFREVKKAEEDPSLVKPEPKSFFANIVETIKFGLNEFSGFFAGSKEEGVPKERFEGNKNPEEDEEEFFEENNKEKGENENTEIESDNNEESGEETLKNKEEEKIDEKNGEEISEESVLKNTVRESKVCSFESSLSPLRDKVMINEVAWMGGVSGGSDEWIELRNVSGGNIDLNGWILMSPDKKIEIIFPEKIIGPSGYFLLERTDDNSVLEEQADVIYSGALSNNGNTKLEGLRLFDSDCVLQDEVLADPEWSAGENSSKRTMERDQYGIGWHTSGLPGGTPKSGNSGGVQLFYGGSAFVSKEDEGEFCENKRDYV